MATEAQKYDSTYVKYLKQSSSLLL
jgi:hypothetical protein